MTKSRGIYKPRARRPVAERFWEKVDKTETCWLWTGALSNGYRANRLLIGEAVRLRRRRVLVRLEAATRSPSSTPAPQPPELSTAAHRTSATSPATARLCLTCTKPTYSKAGVCNACRKGDQ